MNTTTTSTKFIFYRRLPINYLGDLFKTLREFKTDSSSINKGPLKLVSHMSVYTLTRDWDIELLEEKFTRQTHQKESAWFNNSSLHPLKSSNKMCTISNKLRSSTGTRKSIMFYKSEYRALHGMINTSS
jgi:hypothetical protein